MKKVRVGVIGVGRMGQRHCRVYSALRNTQLVGLTDMAAAHGRAVAANYETTFFKTPEQLLREVDAVSIVTATPAHFALAQEAIQQGVHLLVEKPLTETVGQARKLVDLAEAKDLILQVGHIERFNPTYIELKKIAQEMQLISVNMRRLSPFDFSNKDVDVIRDLMIHDLDLIVNLLGKDFESPHALGRALSGHAVDHAIANFSFRQGPIATLMASRITEQKVRTIEVVADGAYIEADLLGKNLVIHRHTFSRFVENQTVTAYRQESILERIYVPAVEPLMLELEHFVGCVRLGIACDVPGEDGLFALELAQRLLGQLEPLTATPQAAAGQLNEHPLAADPTRVLAAVT